MAGDEWKVGAAVFMIGYLLGRRRLGRAIRIGSLLMASRMGTTPRQLAVEAGRRLLSSQEALQAGKSIGGQLLMSAVTQPAERLADRLHERNAAARDGSGESGTSEPRDEERDDQEGTSAEEPASKGASREAPERRRPQPRAAAHAEEENDEESDEQGSRESAGAGRARDRR